MIDIKLLEKNEEFAGSNKTAQEYYRLCLKNRKSDDSIVDEVLELNSERKSLQAEIDSTKAQQNKMGAEIARLKKEKKEANDILTEMQSLAQRGKDMHVRYLEVEDGLAQKLLTLPNFLHPSVPVGASEENNKVIRSWGEPKSFSFKAKEHIELGESLGILDFERAGKITGARFTLLRGAAARLERALIQFMMDTHSMEHGYEEVIPPFIANESSFVGVGQFPKFKEDVFHLEGTNYYLIPTAEVPVTNIYAGEMMPPESLTKGFVAYSPCFRSEAGSYGKDTKGLIRQHQFNKVELVKFCRPEDSEEEHEKLTQNAEAILQKLDLPYRVSLLCSGDISFSAQKCYDLEVWLPGQNAFREISSCSNFGDFQARRANIRFKEQGGKPQFVHTINGSGLAIGRTLIAILENYQQENGSVLVPKALKPYMGGIEVIS